MTRISLYLAACLGCLLLCACSGGRAPNDTSYGTTTILRPDGAMDYRVPGTDARFEELKREELKRNDELLRNLEQNKKDYLEDKEYR